MTSPRIQSMLADPALLVAARDSYAYPTAYLASSAVARLDPDQFVRACPPETKAGAPALSTAGLDEYHGQLLNSPNDEDVVLGICSVIWWGNYLVRGHPRPGRAEVRVRWFLVGNPKSAKSVSSVGVAGIAGIVRGARASLEIGRFGDALAKICEVPWLSIAFGTKVLAFLMPAKVGVYDIHVSRAMGVAGDLKPTGHLSANGRIAFDRYCSELISVAHRMNQTGNLQWTDTDGSRHPWRAVDVERAIFAVVLSASRN